MVTKILVSRTCAPTCNSAQALPTLKSAPIPSALGRDVSALPGSKVVKMEAPRHAPRSGPHSRTVPESVPASERPRRRHRYRAAGAVLQQTCERAKATLQQAIDDSGLARDHGNRAVNHALRKAALPRMEARATSVPEGADPSGQERSSGTSHN